MMFIKNKRKKKTSVDEDAEKLEPLHVAGGTVQWFNSRMVPQESQTQNYLTTQRLY
jgi:hypothetical protein